MPSEGFSNLKELAALNKSLSDKLKTHQQSFDDRIQRITGNIQTIYEQTSLLTIRKKNLNATLTELDKLYKIYTLEEEAPSLLSLEKFEIDDVKAFLQTLVKIDEAATYFEQTNPGVPNILRLRQLYKNGCGKLNRYYQQVLIHYVDVKLPSFESIQALVNDDEEETQPSLELISDDDVANLRTMSHFFNDNMNDSYCTIYAGWRSSTLIAIIRRFYEKIRSSTSISESAVSLASATLNRSAVGLNITSKHKGRLGRRPSLKSHQNLDKIMQSQGRLAEMFDSMLHFSVGSLNLVAESSQFFGDVMSSRSLSRLANLAGEKVATSLNILPSIEITEDDKLERFLFDCVSLEDFDVNNFVQLVTIIIKLIGVEYQLLNEIIPEERTAECLPRIADKTFTLLITDIEYLMDVLQVRMNENRVDFTPLNYLLTIIRFENKIRPKLKKIQEYGINYNIFEPIYIATYNCLDAYKEGIKINQSRSVPNDGTVAELTSTVMRRLQTVKEYINEVGSVISFNKYNEIDSPNDISLSNAVVFISKIIRNLHLNTVQKALSYESESGIRYLFILNNTHYVLQSLTSSGILNILNELNSIEAAELIEHSNNTIKDNRREFIHSANSWSKLRTILSEGVGIYFSEIEKYKDGFMKMKEKHRQAIKDKFSAFNDELDRLHAVQQNFAIPDESLRTSIKNEIKSMIIADYKQFYENYSQLSFSKHTDKYLKYLPNEVDEKINECFKIS